MLYLSKIKMSVSLFLDDLGGRLAFVHQQNVEKNNVYMRLTDQTKRISSGKRLRGQVAAVNLLEQRRISEKDYSITTQLVEGINYDHKFILKTVFVRIDNTLNTEIPVLLLTDCLLICLLKFAKQWYKYLYSNFLPVYHLVSFVLFMRKKVIYTVYMSLG